MVFSIFLPHLFLPYSRVCVCRETGNGRYREPTRLRRKVMNDSPPVRRFGPLFYSVVAVALVLLVVVYVLPLLGIELARIVHFVDNPYLPSGIVLIFWIVNVFSPENLVWLIAGIILFRRRKRHPQVTKYALCAMLGLVVIALVNHVSEIVFQSTMSRSPRSTADLQTYLMLRGLVTTFARAGCWILLFIALLGWRGEPNDTASGPAKE